MNHPVVTGLDEYQALAIRTAKPLSTLDDAMQRGALGLTGEAGEFADIVKKVCYHDHPLDEATRLKLKKELGDILWYIGTTAEDLGWSLADIATMNINKLRERYPDGFSTAASLARVDTFHE